MLRPTGVSRGSRLLNRRCDGDEARTYVMTRVLLKTPLTPFSGYGNDGLGISLALMDAGDDLTLSPMIVQPPLPARVAMQLTRPIEPPYDLFLHHVDPEQCGLTQGEAKSGVQRVLWSMWEFNGMGAQFDVPIGPPDDLKNFRERLATYDTVVVYDEVTRQAFEPHLNGQRVVKVQGGYWSDDWRIDPQARSWTGPFRFCMVGALHQRKNPWIAVHAFNALKAKHGDDFDAELHVKTNLMVFHPAMEETYPGFKIHYTTWPQPVLKEFYKRMHCLLAPSWGEGKNLPALEAMTTGIPVIATKFGGHAEWMNPQWSYEVRFEMGEHVPGCGSARADQADMEAQMWHVYTHRDEVRRKGALAARTIPSMLDWSKVIERLKIQLSL